MRRSLIATTVAALALAAPAAAGLPKAGVLVPGRSLGGIRLGESPQAVRAALGTFYGTCRGCPRRTWYFTYRPFDKHGLAVEFTGGRVSGVYTLWRPAGWHAPHKLGFGVLGARRARAHRRVAHGHLRRLRGARRTTRHTRARPTTCSTAGSGDSASSVAARLPADEHRARGRRARRASDSPASPTARRSSPRARSTSASGARVHVKAECFQRGGAFKFRGAFNKISSLDEDALAARRPRLLVRQPRAGRRHRRGAPRLARDDRHARGRAGREARRDARLRRRGRAVRPLDGEPRGDRRARWRRSAGSSS